MATFYDTATDFEPELPQYAQDIVEAAKAEEQLKQQQIQMEEDVAAGKKAGPPSPEYDTKPENSAKPDNLINDLSEKNKSEPTTSSGTNDPLEYLKHGGMGGNPMETFEDLGQIGFGAIDTVMDVAKRFIPWLKDADEYWEQVSGKQDASPEDKFVRDVSAIVVPTLAIGGPIGGALKAGATRLGFSGLTTGGFNALGKVGIDMAVGTTIEGLSDQTTEEGNLSDILQSTLGLQTPWATQEGDTPDVIYKKNMYEAAALGGMTGAIEVALGSNTLGRIFKQSTKVFPRGKASQAAVEASSAASHLEGAVQPKVMDTISATDQARVAAQNEEAVIRFRKDPEGESGYDPFVNEPHEPQQRAVPDFNADPIKFKLDNAKIQNNTGTYNGRPNPAVTPGFKKAFATAADGSDRSELLEELAEGIDPQFDVMVGEARLTAKQVDEAVDNLVTAAFAEPAGFKERFSELVTATDSLLGNKTKSLTEDGFIVATGAYKRFLDMISPRQQKASAVIVSQSANNVTDASKAVSLIGDTMDTTRQQELAFDALRVMMPEIRMNQFLSGKRLQMKRIAKEGDKSKLKNFIEDSSAELDNQVRTAKKSVEEFLDTALQVSKENPEYLKPLLREFEKTNGEIDSIDKLARLAEKKISFWKKAFIDGEPEIPSLLVRQLQSVRYNNILTGLAPVRAAAGAFTGLIGKPMTTFVGSALTGDADTLKRSMFVYGGIRENIGRGFTNLANEWRHTVEAPQLAAERTRKDFQDVILNDIETMDEMAENWYANGDYGKFALWKITRGLSYFNNNPVVRLGINSMTAIDGFTKSMSASFSARSRAYDELFDEANGAIDVEAYTALQRKLYDQSFDRNGVLKDEIATLTAGELNLNLDSKTVNALEGFMRHVPAAKAIFMFPRTGVNAIKLVSTFSPTGVLGQSIGRGRAIAKATTQAEIDDVLVTHGYKAGNNQAFDALKSEYKGREIMGSAVVMGAALYALNGNLTGSGPSDPGERKRMIDMGWNPYSFRDLNGEWRSYQGLEPFDTFLGLTADMVFEATRLDSSITEEFFQTLAHSISMNVTNKTFLSGFEPLVRMLNGDPGSFQRFVAMQVDSMIPGTGVRSILNKALTPQLKDVETNFLSYLANRNKFLPPVGSELFDLVDVYTGKPIDYTDSINSAVNSLLPFFKTNGGNEEWRQKLLATGWDGLQAVKTNPINGQPLTPEERNFVNNWIGQNYGLDKKVEEFLNKDDAWYERQLQKYVKARGLKNQSQFPIKKTFVYEYLDELHTEAFKQAFAALETQRTALFNKGVLQKATEDMIQQGNYGGAADAAQRIIDMPK
jgi:hypothetical protein